MGFIVLKVVGDPQEQHSHRDICESKARMKPLRTLNGLDFSSLFWLFVVLRGKQLLSCDCSRSLWCTHRQ